MSITTRNYVSRICRKSKEAHKALLEASEEQKNDILLDVAQRIKRNINSIIKVNMEDVEQARAMGMDAAKLDRLTLNKERVMAMANAVEQIAKLPDPIGKVTYQAHRDSGIEVKRVTVPLGVIGVIYESRPNVTSDVAALCLKSGNAVILRSGRESSKTSAKIISLFHRALQKAGLPAEIVGYIESSERDSVKWLLKMDEYVDVIVPRGGKSLIKTVMKETRIPVFKHLDGNCHTYIEEKADIKKARKIVLNAKMRRTGICGATESLVIDQAIADKVLPILADELKKAKCEIRGDKKSMAIDGRIKNASDEDFATEYLSPIVSVKIVSDIDEAIEHINRHSSSHTESIITEDRDQADKFLKLIESAIVMHNASTQFADGGEFGLGAEVGIATGKLHARGPVGLEQLVTYKYIVESDCGIRAA